MIWYKNPLIRSALFVPLIIYASSLPWAIYTKTPFKPVYCFAPFTQYLVDRFILPRGDESRYQQILQVFVDIPELRELAVPPSMGGPQNQIVFVVEGFSLLLSLTLIALPVTWVQLIGFIISMSSNFGYVLSMALYEGQSVLDLSWGVYVDIAFTLLGLVTIVY
ncbi:hypothetical protein TRFO_11255 [Tritrichomonas foetus]|uniref:Transmembrane protein n=1 Tax=Tritrichomonas foetus TaxID=1144522 RepID=A0A1J4J4A6_9EUKA|nr:hypothetical protein TRFO_11255 [Tritrichomonas foetus]|eukprot:OHS94194.1 hypothetical protein TRFO_11255 [Tritrichomonas foetus]